MVGVAWAGRPHNAAKDVGPGPKPFRESVEKLCVVRISPKTGTPMGLHSKPKRSPHSSRHVLGTFDLSSEGWKVEPTKVEGISKCVLADSPTSASRGAAVVRTSVHDPPGGSPVVLHAVLDHQRLELLEPLHKGGVGPNPIAKGGASIADERVRVALKSLALFEKACGFVERVGFGGPAAKERVMFDSGAALSGRDPGKERKRAEDKKSGKPHAPLNVVWTELRRTPNGHLRPLVCSRPSPSSASTSAPNFAAPNFAALNFTAPNFTAPNLTVLRGGRLRTDGGCVAGCR